MESTYNTAQYVYKWCTSLLPLAYLQNAQPQALNILRPPVKGLLCLICVVIFFPPTILNLKQG